MKYKGGISIIIPIYNEQNLLRTEVQSLLRKLGSSFSYEIILIENGSKDKTYHIARQLAREHKVIKVIKETVPSYGSAVKRGLESARYDHIVQFDLDLIDLNFLKKAIYLLQKVDVVVGSKTLFPTSDKRSFMRMFVTRTINYILRSYFGYKGTDTHGIKAYNKKVIIPFVLSSKASNHFFDTEILLRSQANSVKIAEVPVSIRNLRPSRFTMHLRVAQAVSEFIDLYSRRGLFTTISKDNIHLTMDDYGLDRHVNAAIDKIIKESRICTISMLPRSQKSISNNKVRIACHINLIEGKPISDPKQIPSLVDKSGNFYPFMFFYIKLIFNQISFIELTREIEAQILQRIRNNTIVELNSHQHTHALYPVDIIVNVLKKKYKIKSIRTYGNILHFSVQGYLFKLFFQLMASLEFFAFGKRLSRSPIWGKSVLPLSFMSWETAITHTSIPYEIVCHPGTKYDKNNVYTSILR